MLGYLSLDIISSSELTNCLLHGTDNARGEVSELTNCLLLGTDNARGEVSEHIFAPSGDYCSCNLVGKKRFGAKVVLGRFEVP